jgi:hypothetical protein
MPRKSNAPTAPPRDAADLTPSLAAAAAGAAEQRPLSASTTTDLLGGGWLIDDGLVRLRIWGTDRCYPVPSDPDPDAQLTIGASDACSLRLVDPSGWLSREHARLEREGTYWIARDLGSKNGTHLDGVRRPKVALHPGAELGLGGITLIAESPRLIALRAYLARLLGWAPERGDAVDLAVRAVRLAATRRAPLALCGDGDLVPIAHGLHRYALGDDRPFVLCDPRRNNGDSPAPPNHRTGLHALGAADGGSMVVFRKRLPTDYHLVLPALLTSRTRVQLIATGPRPRLRVRSMATSIDLPPLSTRPSELARIIDEYAHDAATSLGVSTPLPSIDHEWVRAHSADSLAEIEKATARLVALRVAGSVAGAAAMLGLAHASLGEWMGRRRMPTGIR